MDHGQNGYTCPAGDTEKFYQATKRLLQDDALRKQMSVRARDGAWRFERSKILQQVDFIIIVYHAMNHNIISNAFHVMIDA